MKPIELKGKWKAIFCSPEKRVSYSLRGCKKVKVGRPSIRTVCLAALIHEGPGVSHGVAAIAETGCFPPPHDPRMGLVAVETLHALFHVKPVLPYFRLIAVALPEAVFRFQLYLSVWLVTLITGETRHGPSGGDLMTLDTFIF
jgi:hypothetical protein